MTPNNIVNMARLKGLDMIAVADHNTARHLPAIEQIARAAGIALLPAMELCSREEVHLLAYFRRVETAVAFSEEMYEHLPPIENRPDLFGRQVERDAQDEFVREETRLLISALDLSIDALTARIRACGGLAVPAHINRGANGILGALGFLPPGADFAAVEIARELACPAHASGGYPVLHSSDAHRLGDILEREVFYDLPACTADGFFEMLNAARPP